MLSVCFVHSLSFFTLGFVTSSKVCGTFIRNMEYPWSIFNLFRAETRVLALVWSSRWPLMAAWSPLSHEKVKAEEDNGVSHKFLSKVLSLRTARH